MDKKFKKITKDRVKILPSLFKDRSDLNKKYMMKLKSKNLLQNFYLEAGLWTTSDKPKDCHWGWESPTCQLRGHFLGHWLSAAAMIYINENDYEIKAKADKIIDELEKCQDENGGEWAGSIPEKYLDWVAKGKQVWAPQYTLHKTLMGLFDMYKYGENKKALDILCRWADWFYDWSKGFSREKFDDILDAETGGMLEVWANLYGETGENRHLELLMKYNRSRLFDPLLKGEDVLTNKHANTTIPEVLGAARAWEVTGEERWFDIVKAYWDQAVTNRGMFCTGGQTSGEIWTAPFKFSARLGDKNQEHCTVYNMMRLAEFLFCWTGDFKYADYWERNLYNGILAQQNADTGMVSYFLPLEPGGQKNWGTETEDFWCCHGSLVQAHSMYNDKIYYRENEEIIVSQYIPSELSLSLRGKKVVIKQELDKQAGDIGAINDVIEKDERPKNISYLFDIQSEEKQEFSIKFRLPWWVDGQVKIYINDEKQTLKDDSPGFIELCQNWYNDKIKLVFPKSLSSCSLPDLPNMVAFMDGPIVLAGLIDKQVKLFGDIDNVESILIPNNERQWGTWLSGYRTKNQEFSIRFKPLYEIIDEKYTVYFPVEKP